MECKIGSKVAEWGDQQVVFVMGVVVAAIDIVLVMELMEVVLMAIFLRV